MKKLARLLVPLLALTSLVVAGGSTLQQDEAAAALPPTSMLGLRERAFTDRSGLRLVLIRVGVQRDNKTQKVRAYTDIRCFYGKHTNGKPRRYACSLLVGLANIVDDAGRDWGGHANLGTENTGTDGFHVAVGPWIRRGNTTVHTKGDFYDVGLKGQRLTNVNFTMTSYGA